MSLDFNLEKVRERLGARWEEITTSPETQGLPEGQQRWHPVTDCIIWTSMVVELGNLNSGNVDEWEFRCALVDRVYKTPILRGGSGSPYFLTRKDLEDHIGLSTNVSTRSRSEWLSRLFTNPEAAGKMKLAPTTPHHSGALSTAEFINLQYRKGKADG